MIHNNILLPFSYDISGSNFPVAPALVSWISDHGFVFSWTVRPYRFNQCTWQDTDTLHNLKLQHFIIQKNCTFKCMISTILTAQAVLSPITKIIIFEFVAKTWRDKTNQSLVLHYLAQRKTWYNAFKKERNSFYQKNLCFCDVKEFYSRIQYVVRSTNALCRSVWTS